MQGAAPVTEVGVERLVLGEPLFGSSFFPEGDDVGWGYEGGHDPDPTQSAACLP